MTNLPQSGGRRRRGSIDKKVAVALEAETRDVVNTVRIEKIMFELQLGTSCEAVAKTEGKFVSFLKTPARKGGQGEAWGTAIVGRCHVEGLKAVVESWSYESDIFGEWIVCDGKKLGSSALIELGSGNIVSFAGVTSPLSHILAHHQLIGLLVEQKDFVDGVCGLQWQVRAAVCAVRRVELFQAQTVVQGWSSFHL